MSNKAMAKALEGELIPADGGILSAPTVRVSRLDSAHGIKRELARVYRAARTGKLATAESAKLAYILDMLRKAHETLDLEERLNRLEQRATRP